MAEVTKEEINKTLAQVFGTPLQVTRTIRGVEIVLRTLYDQEMLGALNKATIYSSNQEEQLTELKRRRLTYSLISVNDVMLPPDKEEVRGIIAQWPNYFVEQAYDLFEEINSDEEELTEILKNS